VTGRTVGVVGLGLVGGSLALDLRDRERSVVGTDTDATARDLARDAGIEVLEDAAAVAAAADLVVVAVPPAAVAGVVDDVVRAAPDVAVTDVASVKAPDTLGVGRPSPRWVGGHPMAGTERAGFAAARPGMLAGATWLLTPADDVDPDALLDVLDLVLSVSAVPVVLDAAEHDRVVAAVSHVTHLLSFALHGVAGGLGRRLVDRVAGPSFRDATRVAASDPSFWADVAGRNHRAVAEVLGEVQGWLGAAATEDTEALAARLAAARRQPLPPSRSTPATVDLADLPAGLAELRRLGGAGHAVTAVERHPGGARVTVARR
jgi:prephenate dehydrogenase